MEHYVYQTNALNEYPIAIVIKESAFSINLMKKHYIDPLVRMGVAADQIIIIGVKYNAQNKIPISLAKEEAKNVLSNLTEVKTKTILVADGTYFKVLTKERTSEPHHGYIKKCHYLSYDHISVILSINYQALFHNPTIKDRLQMSLDTLVGHINHTHVDLGHDVIHNAYFPKTNVDIEKALLELHAYPEITCDIETFSLDFWQAGIGTIAFAWNKHEGMSFPVDYQGLGKDVNGTWYVNSVGAYAEKIDHKIRKAMLAKFFLEYKGKIIYHGGTFDIKILIYELYMTTLKDITGLLKGLNIMYRNVDDSLIITYLATNSCAGNKLGLKHNAFEYTGNYAKEDIKDITKILEDDLLEYNLVDALATWYVKEKNEPIMIADNQQQIHDELYIPSMKVVTHMELIGMPMSADEISRTDHKLRNILKHHMQALQLLPVVQDFQWRKAREAMITKNLLLKRKVKPLDDFLEPFNPASNNQVRELLYDTLGFPIEQKTKSGQASTSNKAIKAMLNKLTNQFNIDESEYK